MSSFKSSIFTKLQQSNSSSGDGYISWTWNEDRSYWTNGGGGGGAGPADRRGSVASPTAAPPYGHRWNDGTERTLLQEITSLRQAVSAVLEHSTEHTLLKEMASLRQAVDALSGQRSEAARCAAAGPWCRVARPAPMLVVRMRMMMRKRSGRNER